MDWSGIYAGGLVSFDSGPTTAHAISTKPDFDPDELDPATNYGVFVGYNKLLGILCWVASLPIPPALMSV